MFEFIYPQVTSVEVIATQPKIVDMRNISYIQERDNSNYPEIVYMIKIYMDNQPSISDLGFDIYLNDYRIQKYGRFPRGIYIKIWNPNFLSEYGGAEVRFTRDGNSFHDSGQNLPDTPSNLAPSFSLFSTESVEDMQELPTQEEVLEN
ncbi:MAG: hypothetical protein QNJ33_02050 [Crocosphaera sp.]|nr:hypothetical protein [Crocosphaera sp.]